MRAAVNRRVSLNLAFITPHDEERAYCAAEQYKNSPSARRQFQEWVQ